MSTLYTQLMCEHLRTMKGDAATTPTPQPVAGRGHTRAATVTASRFEHCATTPGLWLDPQVHLVSSATGRSCNVYYDVVDFIAKDTVEEEVVAGTQQGRQIIVKSGVKPKLEAQSLVPVVNCEPGNYVQAVRRGEVGGWRSDRLFVLLYKDLSANSEVGECVSLFLWPGVQEAASQS